jgi:hypothetical protein
VKRSAIELQPPYCKVGREKLIASKPSSVLDGHLSRPARGSRAGYLVTSVAALVFRPARRAACRAYCRSSMHRGRIGDCCREDYPFHSACLRTGLVSVALALLRGRHYGLSRPATGPAHAFTWHPAICSSDFPLSFDSDHPATLILSNLIVAWVITACAAFVKLPGSGAGTRTPTY